MFNKPSVFGRNDPITRRDAQPSLASGSQTTPPTLEKSASVAKSSTEKTAAVQPAIGLNEANPANPANPVNSMNSIDSTAHAANSGATGASANDSVIGARLIVGPDVKLKGAEILDCDTLVVEGRVEATMDSRVIRIAENGSFAGKVSIDIAEIHGNFEGELTARSQLIIHSTGRVRGTIRYGKLVVDEGGELCGDINVISEKSTAQARPVLEQFVTLSAAAG